MRIYTLTDIRALGPCYNPARHLPKDWSGTLADGLRLDYIPPADRMRQIDDLIQLIEDNP